MHDPTVLWTHLKSNPLDVATKLALADVMNDMACPDMALAMKWMAKHVKFPGHRQRYHRPDRPSIKVPDVYSWGWVVGGMSEYNYQHTMDPVYCRIERKVFASVFGGGDHRYFASCEEACLALGEGMKKILELLET